MSTKSQNKSTLSGIDSGTVYPLPVFRAISGFSDQALRTARRRGLVVRRAGGRAFILGEDFLRYLKNVDDQTENS